MRFAPAFASLAPTTGAKPDTASAEITTGTAHLLPRLLRLPDGTPRASGPLFLASRRPVPTRRPAPRDICPHTGRGRLGYDRARILFKKHTGGLDLHQLRHSAATHLGDQKGYSQDKAESRSRKRSRWSAVVPAESGRGPSQAQSRASEKTRPLKRTPLRLQRTRSFRPERPGQRLQRTTSSFGDRTPRR
jgi:hypothetical protein